MSGGTGGSARGVQPLSGSTLASPSVPPDVEDDSLLLYIKQRVEPVADLLRILLVAKMIRKICHI